jgi:hypothetical protein
MFQKTLLSYLICSQILAKSFYEWSPLWLLLSQNWPSPLAPQKKWKKKKLSKLLPWLSRELELNRKLSPDPLIIHPSIHPSFMVLVHSGPIVRAAAIFRVSVFRVSAWKQNILVSQVMQHVQNLWGDRPACRACLGLSSAIAAEHMTRREREREREREWERIC